MNHPIYFLISTVIGTSVILLLFRINAFTNDQSVKTLQEELLLRNFITTQEIIEYHLKKVGHRFGNGSIIEFDSSKIRFKCDDDLDMNIDELEIRLGPKAENSINPDDYSLIFIRNGSNHIISPSGITKFRLEFFDVNENPTDQKVFIKSIRVTLRMESEIPIDGRYLFFENQILVKPRNLG